MSRVATASSWRGFQHQKSKAVEPFAIHKTIKLLNDDDALQLCRATLLQKEQGDDDSLQAHCLESFDKTEQKTLEISHSRLLDRVTHEPSVSQRQVPTIQTEQKTVEVHQRRYRPSSGRRARCDAATDASNPAGADDGRPHVPFIDKVVDVPVETQRQVPTLERVLKKVNGSPVQYI